MRCTQCDYPLWNLRPGPCPECGQPFKPSDFRLVPNAVRFLCPHCHQDYYGTTADGHLSPRAFDCVRCGQHVDMDDMAVLPTEGVDEARTTAAANPWTERTKRPIPRWWATAIGGLTRPADIIDGTPAIGSTWSALWFAALNLVLIALVGMSCLMLPTMLLAAAGTVGAGAAGGAGAVAGTSMLAAIFAGVAGLVLVPLWAACAHALLWITGARTQGFGRTLQAIGFTSGAYLLTLIPCLGLIVGTVAWVICAGLALTRAHRTGPARAAIAIATPPALATAAVIALYVYFVVSMVQTASQAATASQPPPHTPSQAGPGSPAWLRNWAPGTDIRMGTQRLADALRQRLNDDDPPAHAIELLGQPGVTAASFNEGGGGAFPRVKGRPLYEYDRMPPQARNAIAADIAADHPPGITAHRVGRMLLTYHGLRDDHLATKPELWIMLQLPIEPQEDYYAITMTGYERIDRADPNAAVERQNRLRRDAGLPALPTMQALLARGPWTHADAAPPSPPQ